MKKVLLLSIVSSLSIISIVLGMDDSMKGAIVPLGYPFAQPSLLDEQPATPVQLRSLGDLPIQPDLPSPCRSNLTSLETLITQVQQQRALNASQSCYGTADDWDSEGCPALNSEPQAQPIVIDPYDQQFYSLIEKPSSEQLQLLEDFIKSTRKTEKLSNLDKNILGKLFTCIKVVQAHTPALQYALKTDLHEISDEIQRHLVKEFSRSDMREFLYGSKEYDSDGDLYDDAAGLNEKNSRANHPALFNYKSEELGISENDGFKTGTLLYEAAKRKIKSTTSIEANKKALSLENEQHQAKINQLDEAIKQLRSKLEAEKNEKEKKERILAQLQRTLIQCEQRKLGNKQSLQEIIDEAEKKVEDLAIKIAQKVDAISKLETGEDQHKHEQIKELIKEKEALEKQKKQIVQKLPKAKVDLARIEEQRTLFTSGLHRVFDMLYLPTAQ